jgi:SET domain-containing protein
MAQKRSEGILIGDVGTTGEGVEEGQGNNVIHLPQCQLYLKTVPGKGRGVYASEAILTRTLIHVSPVLIFPQDSSLPLSETSIDSQNREKEILSHYTYTWGPNEQALALGLGSMFNHSRHNNVGFILNKSHQTISYVTLREVKVHDELCISYGSNLWFDDLEEARENTRWEEEGEADHSDSEKENFLLSSFHFEDP